MPLDWSSTSQAQKSNGVKVLIYANSGYGKTALCATAPAPIILSAEAGLLVLNRKNLEKLYGVGNPAITYDIPVLKITTVQDLTDAHTWLTTSPDAAYFQTICIDSITEIAEVVLANAKKLVKDPRQAYGELIEKMENTIRSFRDIEGKNVYMSAKLESYKDETGVTTFGPSMPGKKLGPSLPYFFDEVLRIGVNKTPQGVAYRFIQCEADFQYVAKDRSGALDPLEPPHLAHIFAKIKQGST